MMRNTILFTIALFAIYGASSLYASCPAGYPNEIFCDDFDSYCPTGGPPGTPNCTFVQDGGDNGKLAEVWYNTSGIEGQANAPCGTGMIVEDGKSSVLYDVYSGRFVSRIQLGQQTVRDWVASPPIGDPNQVLNFQRRIAEVHGNEYAALIGSDAEPLTLTFAIGAPTGKLWFSPGYMELAFGTHTDPMNRANTDYAIWPKTPCCNGLVANGPWPMLCAHANPLIPIPLESGCPSIITYPPPVRHAIAAGSLPVLDTDPCHCGDMAHAPQSYHLALFDGQVWWTLRSGNVPPGATVSGSGPTPIGGAPLPPPANYPSGAQPGNFALMSPSVDTSVPKPAGKSNYPVYRSYNTVTITIKKDVFRVELTSIVPASEPDPSNPTVGLYYTYTVTSVADNIPLKYAGPFDRLRSGVGPGCELASDSDWTTCSTIDGRKCLETPQGDFVLFDRVALYGGIGYSVKGACCNAGDGACTIEYEQDCLAHGHWTQASQTCEDTLCCPLIYGDQDHDGSVDMTDFAALQRCITTAGGTVAPGCSCFDFDGSSSITASDVQHFADCAMGPGVPGDGTGSCKGRGW